MPVKDLLPGSYLVRAELLNQDGKVIHSAEKIIKKLKAVPYEWRVDIDGNLRKNGGVVMPIGFFQTGARVLENHLEGSSVIFQR